MVSRLKVDKARDLYLDIEMKKLLRVEDIYKDGTTLSKTLKKGHGTASPYSDFQVISKLNISLFMRNISQGQDRGRQYDCFRTSTIYRVRSDRSGLGRRLI